MLFPLSRSFVGAVPILNGLRMMGRIADREIAIVTLATVFITGIITVLSIAAPPAAIKAAALTLLLSPTYLRLGMNGLTGAGWSGSALSWRSPPCPRR